MNLASFQMCSLSVNCEKTWVIDTSRAIHFISLTHTKTSITKHGATEIQGQVINLVEIEFGILMNSLLSRSNTNTPSFISFNNTGDSPSLQAQSDGVPGCQWLHLHAIIFSCAEANHRVLIQIFLRGIIRKDKAFDYTTSTEKAQISKAWKLKQWRCD